MVAVHANILLDHNIPYLLLVYITLKLYPHPIQLNPISTLSLAVTAQSSMCKSTMHVVCVSLIYFSLFFLRGYWLIDVNARPLSPSIHPVLLHWLSLFTFLVPWPLRASSFIFFVTLSLLTTHSCFRHPPFFTHPLQAHWTDFASQVV